LFVFPSIYEGFGLPPLEAMASGAPVACSRASSLPEVVGEAGLLFDPFDTADLSAVLSLALGDAGLRADLRQRGLEQAARFSWEAVAQQTAAVYAQVGQVRL
jgi:alpha-1,3-rhamnosyl/mannosyltransferase